MAHVTVEQMCEKEDLCLSHGYVQAAFPLCAGQGPDLTERHHDRNTLLLCSLIHVPVQPP